MRHPVANIEHPTLNIQPRINPRELRSQVSSLIPPIPLRFQVSALKKSQVSALKKSQVSALKKTQVSSFRFQPSKSLIPPPLHPSSFLEPQVREVFLRAGANLFAGFTFNRMSPEQAARHIEIEGLEQLKAALAGDRQTRWVP